MRGIVSDFSPRTLASVLTWRLVLCLYRSGSGRAFTGAYGRLIVEEGLGVPEGMAVLGVGTESSLVVPRHEIGRGT